MTFRPADLLRIAATATAVVCALASPAAAQAINEHCTVSVLNRNVRVNPDGSWVLPNVPANFGMVRARVTCVIDGVTVSGESDPFLVPPNGAVNIPPIHFGATTPIPTQVAITAPAAVITTLGGTQQLTVTASYANGSSADVTAASTGTQYTITNTAIATITPNGLVQAVKAGTVLVQATHEGTSGIMSIQVSPAGVDTDGDGIPDASEVALGLNPLNPIDAVEDFDRDGLTNLQEYQRGTDLRNADTDGDGLTDSDEVTRGTSPLLRDTDGDGVSDGLEVTTGSNPLLASSLNLAAALNGVTVAPTQFVLTFNTILGDVTRQLRVTGQLRDGTTIDLTPRARGTNYSSSNLNVCNFSATDGLIFAGDEGSCTITAAVAGFTVQVPGEVHRFAPTPLSYVDLGGPGNGVDVSGSYVYVAAGNAGLKVIDVSNRNAPLIVATLNLPGTLNDVKLAGTRAYVAAGGGGLHIVDVDNPLSPQLLGTLDTTDAQDVRVDGNFAYLADGAGGLRIIDVSAPQAPLSVATLTGVGTAKGVDVSGNLVVVANGVGLRVVNIANRSNPVAIGTVALPGDAQDVVMRDAYAYVADYTGSLQVVRLTNPAAPVAVATTPTATGGILGDVALSGNFLFGADIFFVNGVPIVDVTTPSTPLPRAILDFRSFRDDNGAGIAADGSWVYLGTFEGRLYIGQYRLLEDLEGVAPIVAIASPAPGATFIEGETIPVTVAATDDVTVVSVALSVDSVQTKIDTSAPYQFTVTAPVGATGLTLGASAIDLGSNTGVATPVPITITPDPLTTVVGRVIDGNGAPAAGATLHCLAEAGTSAGDGTFSVPGVRTIQPLIGCTADLVTAGGLALHGFSTLVAPVRGGITNVGDVQLLAVPIIESIRPRIIDSFRAPTLIRLTGKNLTGASFAFVVEGAPIVTAGTAQIDATGTSAILPITVVLGSQGTALLVATNTVGASDSFPTGGNTLTVINLPPTADADADGLTNEYELALGTGTATADSDGDGLPDGYEVRFGFNPLAADAGLDGDGDGQTNAEEFAAGTDPRNAHTVPPVVVETFPVDGALDYPINGVYIARFAEPLRAALPLNVARAAIDAAVTPPLAVPADLGVAAQALTDYMRAHGEGDTVVPGTVRLFRGGIEVAGSVSLSNDRLSVTFTPASNLATNTAFTSTIDGLRDAAGTPMSAPFHSTFTTGAVADNTPPLIVRTNPYSGAGGVPVNTAITLQFNKRINPATLTPANFTIYDNTTGYVSGMVQVDPNGLTASFVPDVPWGVARTISVYPSQNIRDTGGNAIGYYAFSFSTGYGADDEGPSVVGQSPRDAAVNVPVNPQIMVQFNEPLDPISAAAGVQLYDGAAGVPGSVALSDGNRRVTFTPAAPLAPNTLFTIVPSPDVTDVAGNPPVLLSSSSFTTGAQTDSQAPIVTATTPVSGSGSVPTNALVRWVFNEPMNPLTINGGTLFVYPSATGIPIAATYQLSADGRTATLTPASALASSTNYTFYTYGATDLTGQTVYWSGSFTTGAGAQISGPSLTLLTPPNESTNVPLNARVVAVMSGALNPTTVNAGALTLSANGVPVAGTVSLSGDRTIVFVPAVQLLAATRYDVNIAALSDVAGNVGQPAAASFVTGTTAVTQAPTLISIVPAYNTTDVPVGSSFLATFSAPIDPTSVNVSTMTLHVPGIANLAATYQVSGNTVRLTPVAPLPGNTTIYLQIYGVADLAGNCCNYYNNWFRTEAIVDITAPQVIAVTPVDGSTDVGLNAGVVITFSESLNAQTVNNNTVALFANGGRFGGYAGISADHRSVFVNGGQLPPGSRVTVMATSGITDISGNALVDFSSSFTTSAFFDTSRPSVIGIRPSNGAGGVAVDLPIVLFMNDRIDPASAPGALHVSQNGVPVEGSVEVTGNDMVVTFRPAVAWAANALIQIFFDTSAHDPSGNAINGYQASFRTAEDPSTAMPVAVAITPSYGQGNVPQNARITLAFNVPLDPASLAGRIRLSGPNGIEAATVSLDAAGKVVRITPPATLQSNSYYYVEAFAGITSATGVPSQNSGWWYFYTGSPSDTTAPAVLSVTPPHGAVNVGDNAGIIVRFSESINAQSISGNTLAVASELGPIAYSASFSNGNRDVYVTPYASLPDGQVVTVTVNGVTDLSGNAAAPSATQFAVSAGPDVSSPVVVATNPANGLVNVATTTVFELRVNEPVDPATVHSGTWPIYDNFTGQQLAGTYSVSSDGQTIRFVPAAPLAVYRSHSAYFSYYGITDVSGNLIGPGGGLGNFSFTTGATAGGAGPQLAGLSPADGSMAVPRNIQIVIDFDRPIDTLTADRIALSLNGPKVPTLVGFGNGDARVYLTPVNPLLGSSLYTLTLGAVADLTGALATPITTHFTTAPGADLIAPVVTMISPANGAGGVPTNAVIQVSFNERMNPLSVNGTTFQVLPQATGIPVPGSFMVSADGRTVTFVPAAPLAPTTGYYFYVQGIADLVGQLVYSYSSFTTGYGTRTTGPVVIALSPADGSTNVPLNARLTAYFDEPIVPVSIGPGSISLKSSGAAVAGSVALSGDRQSLTFTPAALLTASTAYDVEISGAADMAGNPLTSVTSAFTTGTAVINTNAFSVSAVSPAFNTPNIPVASTFQITFTAPVDPASVSVGTMLLHVPGVANLGATYQVTGNVVTLTPASPLPGNTTVYLQVSGVRDVAGNSVNYVNNWWRTESVFDTTAPTVIAVTPTSDAIGVGLNAPISITFSESLNASTVSNNTVGLFANGARFGGYAGISSDYRTVFLNGGTLPAFTVITIAVTGGVTDASGNPAADYTSTFTTGAGFDTSRPSVIGQRPGNGASGVAADAPVVLFMNEALDPSSVPGALQVSVNGQLVDGAVLVSPNGQTLTFQPADPWTANALVQVFLHTSAHDVNGNAVNGYQSHFRTATDPATSAPSVVAISPTYGQGNVPVNAVVRIGFNVPIDPASLPGALRFSGPAGAEPFTFTLDATARVVTIVPTAGTLVANTYYYTETLPGIRSATGVTQNSSGWWYFYTGAPADTTAPAIRAVTPPHGAVNVGDNAGMIVRFSEPIDALTVTATTIAVNGAVAPVVSSISFGNGNRDVYLTPTAPLPDGQVVTIAVSGVTDLANNAVTTASTQFVVGSGPDVVYPVVVGTNPVNGLGTVPLNAVIALRVNEPVDPSTVHSGTLPVYDNFVGVQLSGSYSVSSDGRTVSFTPAVPLAANRSHSVYFSYYGITDLAGNLIGPGGGLGNFSFTAGSAASASGPQVVGVTPADQLTGVARNVRVVIDFDRAIDTLSAGLIVLSANGQPVPVIIGYGNGDARVSLTPYNPLAASTLYTLTIGAVRDLSGQPLAESLVRHFTTASGVDVIAPAITVVSPANGAGNVPTNALMQAGFSERIDPLTVNGGTFTVFPQATGVPVAASYLIAADGRSATLVPASPLTPLTGYYLQINGVTDLVGQVVYTFTSFTTGAGPQTAPPFVQSVSPPADAAGVPTNAKVSVRMSAPISPVTVGSDAIAVVTNGVPVPGTISMSADRQTITFTPSQNFTPGTTFTVTAGGFADLAGNTAVPFTSTFTTGPGVADPGPLTVTTLTPANGAVEVAVNTAIVATFNKAINPLSVNSGSFLVNYPGVGSVSGTFAVSGATVSFTPASPLPGNTSVFVQVSGVQDLSGLSNTYASATFHTAAVADSTAPTVISVTPGDGATDVGLNAPIVITFSESLNPATVNNNTFALFGNGSRFGYVAAISADSRTVTMNGGTLPASALVSLEITSGVQDLATNALGDFTATFLTAAAFDTTRPSIVGQRPGNGASGVAPALPILLFVNEPLAAGTVAGVMQVTQNGNVVTGTVDLLGTGQVVRFTPQSPWDFNALIQVFMDAGARDLNGNSLNGYSASFRTATDPAATAPVVTATSPLYGSSNVPLNPVITLGYNVPLDATTVNDSTVTLSGPAGVVPAAISLDATNKVIRIVPAQPLVQSAFYSYQTTTTIRGANGLAQQNAGWWYFVAGTTPDTEAPSVGAVTPPHGASDVGDNATLVVRFTEPINPLTVNGSTIAVASPLGAIDTSVGLGNGNRDVYLTPNAILPDGGVVSITIAGVTDLSGNAAAATATQFSVAAGPDVVSPIVTSTNPVNGLTGVPTNAVIALRFNEPIDPPTVHRGTFQIYDNTTGQQVQGNYAVAGDARTVSFVPSALGVNRSYSVYFSHSGITDLSGNVVGPAGGYGNFSFVTGATADTSGPHVVAISPADQLTGVPRNAQVMVDFDRSIDALSVGQIALMRGGQRVNTSVSFANGDSRVTLTPLVPLQAGAAHAVDIGAVTDLGGSPLATAVSSQFTTGSSVDLTAPAITGVAPANGATGVAVTASVVVTFNERMNPLSINAATLALVEYNTGVRVPADVAVAADGRSAGLVPASALKPDTLYYISGSGLADLVGQQASMFTTFRTAP